MTDPLLMNIINEVAENRKDEHQGKQILAESIYEAVESH
jgi:hypothetical protein